MVRGSEGTGEVSGFFGADVGDAIERLALEQNLTIVVGAGASAEAGLPNWEELVHQLLRAVAHRRGLEGGEEEAFVRWALRDGLPSAGAIAKAELGGDFPELLAECLFAGRSEFVPGPTWEAVSSLRVLLAHSSSEVVTTNYDQLGEQALEDAFRHTPLTTGCYWDDRPQGPDEVACRHLHGVIEGGVPKGDLVLSEADYHLMQAPGQWQESYMAQRLEHTTCLFVGSSLTDPNLLRYLYRGRPGTSSKRGRTRHVVVLARQGEAQFYAHASPVLVKAREETASGRWRAMGVEPVLVDYYSQVAQFVSEVAARKRLGDGYVPLDERLNAWEHFAVRLLRKDDPNFVARQGEVQAILGGLVGLVRSRLAAAGGTPRDEVVQASWWLYLPSERSLVNWASSDRLWTDAGSLRRVAVHWQSQFVAVEAFCQGSVCSRSVGLGSPSRWRHVVGVPLHLGGAARLPVGALTLASTAEEPESCLSHGLAELRSKLLPSVGQVIADLFLDLGRVAGQGA
jgi:hypothetical protein